MLARASAIRLSASADSAAAVWASSCASVSVQGRFLYFGAGIAPAPEAKAAVERHVELVQAALAPWDTGLTFLNFMERPTEPQRFFPPDVHRRLREIKARVDPDDLLQANHPV